jgi:CheY-like chemotaxis protein
MQHFLADAGYHVLPTKTSDEALALCRDYERTIDLLVTDADLPGTSAWELAERAAALRPGIVILYLSSTSFSPDITGALLDSKSHQTGTQALTKAMLLDVTQALIHKTQEKVQ